MSNRRHKDDEACGRAPRGSITLKAEWYHDSEHADITVIYGPNRKHRFRAHRLILCNTSVWFRRALRDLKEANSNEIILHGDHADGVEALLEFCYRNDYNFKEVFATTRDERTEQTKNLLMLHVRTFATADKYGLDDLKELAFTRLRTLLEICTQDSLTAAQWCLRWSFIRPTREDGEKIPKCHFGPLFHFMVEQLYESRGNLLSNEHEAGAKMARPTDTPLAQCESDSDNEEQTHAGLFELDSHENDAHQSSDPLGHVRELLVVTAMHIWDVYSCLSISARNRQIDFRLLTTDVPKFGADLAVAALEYGFASNKPPPYKNYLRQLGKL